MARRLSYEQMLSSVTDEIKAAGGTIDHNTLMGKLEPTTAQWVIKMAENKDIVPQLDANPNGKAVLRYSLPVAPAPVQPAPVAPVQPAQKVS